MKQDEETAAWFGEVLHARSGDEQKVAQDQAKELQRQLTRARQQQDQLLDLRLSGQVDDDLYHRKGVELRDRIAVLKEQLDGLDVTRGQQADHAVKVFELSQRLAERWLTADYAAKREILDIVCSNFVLKDATLDCTMRKPFALLCEGLLVSNSGEGGIRTPDWCYPIQHFQCCSFSHSDTSPARPRPRAKRC